MGRAPPLPVVVVVVGAMVVKRFFEVEAQILATDDLERAVKNLIPLHSQTAPRTWHVQRRCPRLQ